MTKAVPHVQDSFFINGYYTMTSKIFTGIVILSLVKLLLVPLLRKLKQLYLIAYMLAGIGGFGYY